MVQAVVEKAEWDANDFDELLDMAPSVGVFMNVHTLEVDLFLADLSEQFADAMKTVGTTAAMKKRMLDWATKSDDLADPASEDTGQFLKDIDAVGKGRFAQRLASVIAESGTRSCPEYISNGVKYVVERCKRS